MVVVVLSMVSTDGRSVSAMLGAASTIMEDHLVVSLGLITDL